MRERVSIPGGPLMLVVVFVTALLVRVIPAGRGMPIDYDEGVYVTAALLLAKGLLPYRDYVFLHPPGIVLFLLPWTAGGPLFALRAARVVSSLLGATNSVLMARLVGGRGAIPTAIFWIVWPELVWSERGVFLEPLMTCAGLGALVLITGKPSLRRATLSGLLCGAAVLVKSWGVVWCLVAFLACPQPLRLRLVLSAVATVTAVLLPFLFVSGAGLGEQLVLVHLGRPPDGDLSRVVRLREMFVERNPWPALLAALSIPFVLRQPGHGRVALVGFGVLCIAFLAAPAYWNQYNAALVPFELWVLGTGLNVFSGMLPRRWWAAGFVVVCVAALPSRRIAIASPATPWPQLEAAESLRSVQGDLCSFEVSELLLVDRLPALTTPVLVDSYGQMLLDAKRGGEHFESASAALSSESAQLTLRRQLLSCPVLHSGERGEAQMNPATRAQVGLLFQSIGPALFLRK